jgi:hypothetical protein
MSKSRLTGVAIANDVAQAILENHIPAAALADPAALWPYGPPGEETRLWKRSARWAELYKSRALLEDIADATGGRTLLHKSWLEQLHNFFQQRSSQHKFKDKDILRASYRSRAMLAHIRDARRDRKTPPARYKHLAAVLDRMVVDSVDAAGEVIEAGSECECDSSDVEEAKEVASEDLADVVSIGSSECESNYSFHLFAEAPEVPTSSLSTSTASEPAPSSAMVLSDDAIAKLVGDAAGAAIDPRTGDKNVGFHKHSPMKRPAAATPGETPSPKASKATVLSASKGPLPPRPEKRRPASSQKKLLYSKTYHQALLVHQKVCLADQAKEKARDAARAAVAHL